MFVVLLLQDALLDRLTDPDIRVREAAHEEIVRLGRDVYGKLPLTSEDEDLRARARAIAYDLGVDPDTHRPWEDLWEEQKKDPTDAGRERLIELACHIRHPRLTLFRKLHEGGDPTAREWEEFEGGRTPAELYEWGLAQLWAGAPFEDVLGAWRALVRVYPESSYADGVSGYVRGLERMIEEPDSPDWVFRLREAISISRGDVPRIRATLGPAPRKLLALGKEAVPALIACLGDPRLTRCVGSHSVLTYGEAAAELLAEITGLGIPPTREDYRAWWKRAKDLEPREWWRDWLVGEGIYPRAEAAKRLLDAEGNKAVPDLIVGMKRAPDRDKIIAILGGARHEAIAPAIEALLPDLIRRELAVAAEALRLQGRRTGLEKLREMKELSLDELRVLCRSGEFEFAKPALDIAGNPEIDEQRRVEALYALLAYDPKPADRLASARRIVPALDMSRGNRDRAALVLRRWFPDSVTFDVRAEDEVRARQIRGLRHRFGN